MDPSHSELHDLLRPHVISSKLVNTYPDSSPLAAFEKEVCELFDFEKIYRMPEYMVLVATYCGEKHLFILNHEGKTTVIYTKDYLHVKRGESSLSRYSRPIYAFWPLVPKTA